MAKMGYEGRTVHFEWHNKREKKYGYDFKSQIERKWADYLETILKLDVIGGWKYEPTTFECGSKNRKERIYTPDFGVLEAECGYVFHETKTSLRQKDISRFKWLRQAHPDIKIVLVLPRLPKSGKQLILVDKARKYVDRVLAANPLFKEFNIK